MKRVLLASTLLALLFGPLITFTDSVAWVRVRYRYEPPLSQDEMRQWDQGSVAQLKAELAKREVPYTRAQWFADSVGQRYFWVSLVKRSAVPIIGVFLACLCISGLELRRAGRSVAGSV